MNVLIAYAVDPEFTPWRKLLRLEKISAGLPVQRARIGSATADFLVTGMGPEYATRAMQSVRRISYDACICAGFAGALRPEYHVGDIFVPARIEEAEKRSVVICDPILFESAKPPKPAQTLLSSATIIASSAEKETLSAVAGAVDMESFTVISAAQKLGIPALAVRVISDTRDQDMPVDFSKSLDERGQVSIGSVLKLLAGQPGKLAALMRLGRQSKLAAEALAHFLLEYIRTLPDVQRVDSMALSNGTRGR
jgi:nucleoside phosphorylase